MFYQKPATEFVEEFGPDLREYPTQTYQKSNFNSLLEQLDLALEHVTKRDVHNARFALMLTDNIVELVLHQIAKDKHANLRWLSYKNEIYEHQKVLDKALLKSFEDKVRFARLEKKLSLEHATTIKIMHEFRNEVYHAGLAHEDILPQIALLYLELASEFIGSYSPSGLGWGSSQKLPGRAKKYFKSEGFFPGTEADYKTACASLAAGCNHDPTETIAVLAGHMDRIIEEQDGCIDVVAQGVYQGQQRTRDRAVVECQAWPLAFSEKGKLFAIEIGWSGNPIEFVDFVTDNYPFKYRGDPIPAWSKQAATLRSRKDVHSALVHYSSFMTETEIIREYIERSAAAAEAEIDAAIDRARGK